MPQPRAYLPILALALASCTKPGPDPPVCAGPFDTERLRRLAAKATQVSADQSRAIAYIKACGVSAPLSDSLATELGKLGANEALLAAIRAKAPPSATTTPAPPPPPETNGQVNPVDGMTYRWIPPGEFQMGCSPDDKKCENDEKPPRKVKIEKGFWLAQTETTVDAYRKVIGKMPAEINFEGTNFNPGWKEGSFPIVNVTWQESANYCTKIGGRLPTEQEWEYAARAQTTGPFYGDLGVIAWYADNSGLAPLDSDKLWFETTKKDLAKFRKALHSNGNTLHRVATKLPNAWGLHDMLGNVWEWTNDWYHTASIKSRVVRGGSSGDGPAYLRVSIRGGTVPTYAGNGNLGFRCAWDRPSP